ncbi:c-type cytochrome [candidate division KSB1 bacterium]|nr:c-type cytochrome [candidate division KSB1 bacterium]NIT71296.1 c-type cytochrome [candidate division KSB1 bacterium]NIX70976.1 c-type cytochrome [candidate division KSB1 bacterium]
MRHMILVPLMATVFFLPFESFAQVPWPDKPENVKVLPKDISKQELRRTMFQFATGLGVRCSHCHVAEDVSDLSTYDFASDEKQTKRMARIMMKLVETINNKELAKLGEHRNPAIEVACMTCHRGYKKPQSLESVLSEVIAEEGVRAAIQKYHELHEKYADGQAFDFGPNPLNRLGYQLLGKNKIEEAIEIFKLNVQMHPDAWNPNDSLAEAYMKSGNHRLAVIFYNKSLELNPDNQNAIRMLDKLSGQKN